MTGNEQALIAMLLGDAPPDAGLRRWLGTLEGRRALGAYRRTLARLDTLPATGDAPLAWYTTLASPIGRLLVATTGAGLVRVTFAASEARFVRELRERYGLAPVRDARRTADVVAQLRAYFAGTRRRFAVPVDLGRLTRFQQAVLRACARVPAGRVVSYGEIARRIGRPRGSRAVGQALGRNPVPIVIPCHRVVAGGGRLGGYTGGLHIKRALLRLEGAEALAG
jgi:methylated-DNA-[protein]-cysteine S-methyltransferase